MCLYDVHTDKIVKLRVENRKLNAENEKLKSTMRLHAGDCCSLNNEVELFRCHWEDAEERIVELEVENKRLKSLLKEKE